MYLTKLSETQKELFLNICISLSKIDNDFHKDEKEVISQLCDEMNIEPRYETSIDINEAVKNINVISTVKEKRIIIVELLGLAIADKKLAFEEENFINNVMDSFNLDKSELKEAISLVRELYDLYAKFGKFLDK
jgi:uncharacterized tellurite resistance protein B-like protein